MLQKPLVGQMYALIWTWSRHAQLRPIKISDLLPETQIQGNRHQRLFETYWKWRMELYARNGWRRLKKSWNSDWCRNVRTRQTEGGRDQHPSDGNLQSQSQKWRIFGQAKSTVSGTRRFAGQKHYGRQVVTYRFIPQPQNVSWTRQQD